MNSMIKILPVAAIAALAVCWLFGRLKQKKRKENGGTGWRQAQHFIMAVLGILFLAFSFIGLQYVDAQYVYGTFYYGHSKPKKVEIPKGISETSFLSPIYLYDGEESGEKLRKRLTKRTGFAGKFEKIGDNWTLTDGERRIFVDSWNRWKICWDTGKKAKADFSRVPLEWDARDSAEASLHSLGLAEKKLKYAGTLEGYEDGYLHLAFEEVNKEEEQGKMSWGKCVVTVGESGRVLSVDYGIVNCKFVARESTISPRKAIRTACDTGTGECSGEAAVKSVEPSWYFHEDTGYLTPAWTVKGVFKTEDGKEYPWEPVIDGIK